MPHAVDQHTEESPAWPIRALTSHMRSFCRSEPAEVPSLHDHTPSARDWSTSFFDRALAWLDSGGEARTSYPRYILQVRPMRVRLVRVGSAALEYPTTERQFPTISAAVEWLTSRDLIAVDETLSFIYYPSKRTIFRLPANLQGGDAHVFEALRYALLQRS